MTDHTKINDGGPAYPQLDGYGRAKCGMSLRDVFANSMAPAVHDIGMMEAAINAGEGERYFDTVARAAYKFADALLKAREQQPS